MLGGDRIGILIKYKKYLTNDLSQFRYNNLLIFTNLMFCINSGKTAAG